MLCLPEKGHFCSAEVEFGEAFIIKQRTCLGAGGISEEKMMIRLYYTLLVLPGPHLIAVVIPCCL